MIGFLQRVDCRRADAARRAGVRAQRTAGGINLAMFEVLEVGALLDIVGMGEDIGDKGERPKQAKGPDGGRGFSKVPTLTLPRTRHRTFPSLPKNLCHRF